MKNNAQNEINPDYVSETDWYRFDINTLCRKLGTDKENGLTSEAVRAKRAVQGKNDIFPDAAKEKDNAPKTAFSVLSVLLIICLILSSVLLGDKTSLPAAIMTVIGYIGVIILFLSSKRKAESLSQYSTPDVRVIRDGKTYRINQTGIVQGDLIYLCEGDLAPCDGRLVSASSLKVLEKNISGGDGVKDADFYERLNGLDTSMQKNMVFARSAVASGSCFMVACDTGHHTLPVRRGIKAKVAENSALDIFTKVSRFSRVYAVICSIILFTVTVISFIRGGEENIFSTFLLLLSVAASSYCELLCAFAYAAVSHGISPSSEKKKTYNTGVVIKNLSAVKRLRELSCLMVPKSAGICERRIVAEKIFTNDRELDVKEENADKLRRTVYIALSTFGGHENHAKSQTAMTQELDAVTELADTLGISYSDAEKSMIPLEYSVGDGEHMFDVALVTYRQQYMICVRGSAAQVVNRCSRRISNGTPVPLSQDGVNDLLAKAEEYEEMAYRVLAIATKPSKYNNLQRTSYAEDDLCFEGFIIMREPFAENSAETVAELEKIGVKTVMFCDDMTAQSVNLAKKIGICRDESQMLSAPEFVSSNINIIDLKMMSYRLFRGLGSRQKRYVADSYLAAGEHIGVIGQHLYDISLMNGTDTVGFAANLTLSRKKNKDGTEVKTAFFSNEGSEALKRAADVIIRPVDRYGNGGINGAYEAILTARKVCNNIRNILCYIIASNTARLLIALLSVFTGLNGLSPIQTVFSGIVVDLIAVICMCTADNRKLSKDADLFKKASENPIKTALMSVFAGLISGGLALGGSVIAAAGNHGDTSASAVCFTSLILLQICGCFELSRGRFGFFDGLTNIHIISAILVLEYLALSAVFPTFFSTYLTGTVYTSGIIISAIPAILFIAVCAVLRIISNIRIKKKEATE
ncbi:MAG: cation-transporting P-type ATPase [Clostridia bacterium]|nr:cation-transporting P-type ATPase [Clostridia bacterium]